MTESSLNRLYRFISIARGSFPDPLSVEAGLVSDGHVAAVFTIQNVDQWDSEKRASDYGAFAFFPLESANQIDFVELLNNDFFWTPTHSPISFIEYNGPSAATVPLTALRELLLKQTCMLGNPRAIGNIIAKYGEKSKRWVCLMKAENTIKIECDSWK